MLWRKLKMKSKFKENLEKIKNISEFNILKETISENSGKISEMGLNFSSEFDFEKYILFRGNFASFNIELSKDFKRKYFSSFGKSSFYKKFFLLH